MSSTHYLFPQEEMYTPSGHHQSLSIGTWQQSGPLEDRDSHKVTVICWQAQKESIMGGIIILLTPAPVIDSFRAWKASLCHKDTASWCQQHLNLRIIVDQYALQVLEDSLIPDPPDVGHAGQEAEEGGEAGGQHYRVLRQPVVSEEDKGQQEVGVGGTCNNNLTHLTMAFSPYMSYVKLTESQQNQKTR